MKVRAPVMASRVRLGVVILKVTRGVGCSASEVSEDMVMPRGAGSVGALAVHTTTGCGSRRITARNRSKRGLVVEVAELGWIEGGAGGVSFHGDRGDGELVRNLFGVSVGPTVRIMRHVVEKELQDH